MLDRNLINLIDDVPSECTGKKCQKRKERKMKEICMKMPILIVNVIYLFSSFRKFLCLENIFEWDEIEQKSDNFSQQKKDQHSLMQETVHWRENKQN